MASTQARLFARYLDDLPAGTLDWIGLRPERKQPMKKVQQVMASEGRGLEGDRRCKGTPGSARQVTIISCEYLQIISSLLKRDVVPPEILRRNLVTSGINLTALRHQRFRIGDTAIFEGTALCHPCRRMEQEEVLGKGGVAAMLGHGGICAKIIVSGEIRCGDPVHHLGPVE